MLVRERGNFSKNFKLPKYFKNLFKICIELRHIFPKNFILV